MKKKKIEKNFFFSEVIGSENVAINCLFQEKNTCHWQPMGIKLTTLRFQVSLRETFST